MSLFQHQSNRGNRNGDTQDVDRLIKFILTIHMFEQNANAFYGI